MSMQQPNEHDYDGIHEADNPMPRWWVELFFACILVSAFYFVAFTFFDEFRIDNEYATDLARHRRREDFLVAKAAKLAATQGTVAERVDRVLKDSTAVTGGKVLFAANCASCHGEEGEGIVGPNLTDDYWLHGDGKAESIATVIGNGVDGKGMPPWKDTVTADQLLQLTAYVRTLRGTKPARPKAPQGIVQR